MAERKDFAALNAMQRYTQWATFRIIPGLLPEVADREEVVADAKAFFAALAEAGKVEVRGVYDITGLRAEADYMIWWHAEEFTDLQLAFNEFRRETLLGRSSEVFWLGNGLHRPSEFNKAHLPSFIMGEEPGDWITVYPFVRSYDWYVMEPEKRRKILAEHGMSGREFGDVRANTVPAFALGDYEWVLAFEGPELHRIVDLMHRMRYTEARLHVREEIPFFSGRRVKDLAELINVLP